MWLMLIPPLVSWACVSSQIMTNSLMWRCGVLLCARFPTCNHPPQSILVQLAPKECLLSASDSIADGSKLRQVVQRCNILITERKKSRMCSQLTIRDVILCVCVGEFTSKDIEQDLNRLLNLSSGSSSTLRKFFQCFFHCLSVMCILYSSV